MQPSKSVSRASVSALLASGWTSCEVVTLSFGRRTTDGMPAVAQYAATAAEVSPVEAHMTALISVPSWIICWTAETSTVMPRSLNEPV